VRCGRGGASAALAEAPAAGRRRTVWRPCDLSVRIGECPSAPGAVRAAVFVLAMPAAPPGCLVLIRLAAPPCRRRDSVRNAKPQRAARPAGAAMALARDAQPHLGRLHGVEHRHRPAPERAPPPPRSSLALLGLLPTPLTRAARRNGAHVALSWFGAGLVCFLLCRGAACDWDPAPGPEPGGAVVSRLLGCQSKFHLILVKRVCVGGPSSRSATRPRPERAAPPSAQPPPRAQPRGLSEQSSRSGCPPGVQPPSRRLTILAQWTGALLGDRRACDTS
jgi:hypothetical protein